MAHLKKNALYRLNQHRTLFLNPFNLYVIPTLNLFQLGPPHFPMPVIPTPWGDISKWLPSHYGIPSRTVIYARLPINRLGMALPAAIL